jgi:hypothetical protein
MAEESKEEAERAVLAAAGAAAAAGDRVKLKKWSAVALWSFDVGV